jgi:hypothetical protein
VADDQGLRSTLPVPPDAPCLVCGRPRMTWRSEKYAPGHADRDEFCSTGCAREWHGCPLPATATGPRQTKPWQHGTEYGYRQGCRCGDCTHATAVARATRRRQEKAA